MGSVKNISYTFNSSRLNEIFFGASQAPIAPKENGGYYLCYRSDENDLHVIEFDSSDKLIEDFNTQYKAIPFDIIEINDGFAIYAREVDDENHSFLLVYDSKYKKINEATLMDNGADPTTTKDAIVFYNSNNDFIYGLNAMYKPTNAKLAYGNDRINLIFAHYNHFGADGGHTGDTYYSFDLKCTKESVKYAWSWYSSHSLIQSHIFDGKYFITATLGDAYPQGFTITAVNCSYINDKEDTINYNSNQTIVKSFPGNFGGNSLGRLGGIMQFDDYYVIIYSVKKNDNEERDGIFLTKFKYDGKSITTVDTKEIINGVGSKLKNLRAAKFVNKILITYIHNKDDFGTDYPSYYQDMDETMYYIVCDTYGNIETGPLESSWQHQALNEDIRPLKDGSLRWGYIDVNNVLRIIKIEKDHSGAFSLSLVVIKLLLLQLILIGF